MLNFDVSGVNFSYKNEYMEDWKTVITLTQPHEAHIICGFLESEGIETNIKDEFTVQVHNFYSNAIGGVKVQIKGTDVEKGIEILEKGGYISSDSSQPARKIELVDLKINTDKTTCPFCACDNIGRNKEASIVGILVYFILGAFFPLFRRNYICFDCGKEWKYKTN